MKNVVAKYCIDIVRYLNWKHLKIVRYMSIYDVTQMFEITSVSEKNLSV